jgi:hypothetical protein
LARLSRYEKILLLLFFLSLPLINPWVRGDGVGYYAFGRALLIQHDLNFKQDWLRANLSFRMGRTDAQGNILPTEYTLTGHLDNHFSVGPAILWSPFLLAAHLGVLSYDALGGHVPADGFAKPYVASMALGTALFGFLSLWISFHLSRKYLAERWAFLATLGIWFATSLPVYMYFNPSWSHPLSAFAVALFVWYWDRTRDGRSWSEGVILGAIGGLNDGCVSPQRHPTDLPCPGIVGFRGGLSLRFRGGFSPRLPSDFSLSFCGVFNHSFRGISAYAHRQENNLWQLFELRLHGALVLEFTRRLQGVLFSRSWTLQLDSDHAPRCNWFMAPAKA